MKHCSIEKVELNRQAILAIASALTSHVMKYKNAQIQGDLNRDIAYEAEQLHGIFSHWDVSEDVEAIEIRVIKKGSTND